MLGVSTESLSACEIINASFRCYADYSHIQYSYICMLLGTEALGRHGLRLAQGARRGVGSKRAINGHAATDPGLPMGSRVLRITHHR